MGRGDQSGKDRTVRFMLDGECIELHDVDPTRTVLQFLRDDLGRTGTKEGCAEGDCGACTVAVAELDRDGERLKIRAINSCIQFLATLDGRELITVESLKKPDGSLHPVQKALHECHASQCGFCTPGFVMSLFAQYKNHGPQSRREVDDALAGNLCRCTGYQPIVDAATRMHELADKDDAERWLDTANSSTTAPSADEKERVEALQKLQREVGFRTGNNGRRFFAPRRVDELAQVMTDNPDATMLAGGTDVGLWVTKQFRELTTVVYTGQVDELQESFVDDDSVNFGGGVTFTDAMPLLSKHFPELDELFLRFASPPIRNAGTLGGNVANGSPIGDSMPALLALNTSVVLRHGNRQRVVPLSKFYLDYMKNLMRKGEFVEWISIPRPRGNYYLRSYKISKRFDQDISAVCGAFWVQVKDGVISDARVAFGGMAAIPKRAIVCEAALRGQPWRKQTIERASVLLESDYQPIGDMRASAAYRMQVAKNLLLRFQMETAADGPLTDVYAYGR